MKAATACSEHDFSDRVFELSSCGRIYGRQDPVNLARGSAMKWLDAPALAVALAELFEPFRQFLKGRKLPPSGLLILESAEKAFDTAIAFAPADEGR